MTRIRCSCGGRNTLKPPLVIEDGTLEKTCIVCKRKTAITFEVG